MRLTHKGRGQVIAVEERPYIDATVQVPRVAVGRKLDLSRFKSLPRRRAYVPPAEPTAYRPGPFLEIASDGCRFTISDNVMCGAKSIPGKAWCACHHKIVYDTRGRT